jgi:hypothetical protein
VHLGALAGAARLWTARADARTPALMFSTLMRRFMGELSGDVL